nr:hypothetical protein [Tanacetum cinerariifolium]
LLLQQAESSLSARGQEHRTRRRRQAAAGAADLGRGDRALRSQGIQGHAQSRSQRQDRADLRSVAALDGSARQVDGCSQPRDGRQPVQEGDAGQGV